MEATIRFCVQSRWVCPHCRSGLIRRDRGWSCEDVQCRLSSEPFPVVHGVPVLIDFASSILDRDGTLNGGAASPVARSGPNALIANTRRAILGGNRVAARNQERFVRAVAADSGDGGTRGVIDARSRPCVLVIGDAVLGAGMRDFRADSRVESIGFDVYYTDRIDVIADAHRVPLRSESVDGVWIQAVLEHVLSPERVVDEIYRVLRPGGVVYAETAFLQHVHEEAWDFTRFTHSGHRWLFRRFAEVDSGVVGGPATQFLWSADHLARALTRSTTIGRFVRGVLSPLRLLDHLCSRRGALNGATGFYFLGVRGDASVSEQSMVSYYIAARRGGGSRSEKDAT